MKKRSLIIALIVLLSIGFAAVTTTLVINGNILFGTNDDEFTVIFSKAIVDDINISSSAISDDGKTITYETKELAIVGEESILDFTVKNNSTQYDADININCIGGANEGTYYELEYDLPTFVAAQSEIDGYVTARMIRSSVNEIIEELTCTLNVTAMERTEAAEYVCMPDTTCNEEGDVCWTDSDCSNTRNMGDVVSLGTKENSVEQFYILSTDESNTKMISMYNLYVGGEYNSGWTAYTNPTGIQDSTMIGYNLADASIRRGVTGFSSDSQKGTNYSDYSGSIVEGYVNNYSAYLTNTLTVENSVTLISKEELESIVGNTLSTSDNLSTLGAPSWLYSTSYWTRSAYNTKSVWYVSSSGNFRSSEYADYNDFGDIYCANNANFGVRPVVTIGNELFESDEDDNTVSPVSLSTDDNGNGVADLGEIVSIEDEQFYVISNDGTNIKILTRYNLYVGGEYNNSNGVYTTYTNPTGIQESTMLGYNKVDTSIRRGVTAFSSDEQKGTYYSDYSGSIAEVYVNTYSNYLKNTYGITNTATILSLEDLESIVGSTVSNGNNLSSLGAPEFLYATSYWTRTISSANNVYYVLAGHITHCNATISREFGVRPLVTISADLLN